MTTTMIIFSTLWVIVALSLPVYVLGQRISKLAQLKSEYAECTRRWESALGRHYQTEKQDSELDRLMTKLNKRISEVREIAGLLEERAPDLYQQCPWVIGWLASTDKYLCDLRNVMRPIGFNTRWDEERAEFERHMPLPDRLGKHWIHTKWPLSAEGVIVHTAKENLS